MNTLLYPLSDYAIMQATGQDTVTFFQGQLTNDMKLVTETQAQLTASCSAKGRMLVNFRLFQQAGAYYLILPKSLLAPTLKKLRMYIMHADVTLEDVSESVRLIGFEGAELGDLGLALPEQAYAVTSAEGVSLIRVEQARYLGFSHDIERMQTLWDGLAEHGQVMADQAWRLSEIRAGVPTIVPQTVESFVPQMANLALLDGVSFTKGCYTGQEIVARMHYLGKLKKRMYYASMKTTDSPQPGDKIYRAETDQSVGEIVDVQPTGSDDSHELLAVLQIAQVEKALYWQSKTGPELTLLTLPYAFE